MSCASRLQCIYSESADTAHKPAKGTKVSVRTVKVPGFGPKSVLRCALPFTVFLKLKDIAGNMLPPYDEEFREVAMSAEQAQTYLRPPRGPAFLFLGDCKRPRSGLGTRSTRTTRKSISSLSNPGHQSL